MRIVHVTQGYWPAVGGTERVIQRVSEELVQRWGDQVTVLTTDCYSGEAFNRPGAPRIPVGTETLAGVTVRRFRVLAGLSSLLRLPQEIAYRRRLKCSQRLRAWYQGPIVPGLRRALRNEPADMIAASSFPLLHMFVALAEARRRRVPCVFLGGLHPDDDWGFQRPMIFDAIRAVDHYVAYTSFEAAYVRSRGADPDRVSVIGLGVDPEPFMNVSQAEAKRRLGIDPRAPLVGFIGQLGHHKGVGTLLEAMALVWQQVPETKLLIAGASTSFVPILERTLAGWSGALRSRVILRYDFPEEDKPWLFGAIDLFAYPSGLESFGIAFLEAWSAGKPVIGCSVGAVQSVVNGGRDGLLVRYQDAVGLGAAIVALLASPSWSRALGEAGHRKVRERYTWPQVVAAIRDVYAQCVARADRLGTLGSAGVTRG